ncbi:MAG: response regulator transcription factor [Deltaproteobacteria bacterium]|nr:response regulator transcription factor [Deltaproteobacteria bacterium]
MEKVLVIEDDENILTAVKILLEEEGFAALTARTLADGRNKTEAENPDIVLLDLMLPDGDGLDYCREYRQKRPGMPVIIVSAKDEEVDKVVGLEIGADDYLTKPFSKRELVARIKSVLRRTAKEKDAPALDREKTLTIRGMKLNPKKYELSFKGTTIRLQPKEFDLLYVLATAPNKVMNRKYLLKTVWGYGPDIETRTIDVHIKNLRVKLKPFFGEDNLIITVPTEGYKLIR